MSAAMPSGGTLFPQDAYFTMMRKIYLQTKLEARPAMLPTTQPTAQPTARPTAPSRHSLHPRP